MSTLQTLKMRSEASKLEWRIQKKELVVFLICECIEGKSVFDWQSLSVLFFSVILEKTIRIPRSLSVKAASILKGFLNKNPVDRLGCNSDAGFTEIMTHQFFKSIEWELVSRLSPDTYPDMQSQSVVVSQVEVLLRPIRPCQNLRIVALPFETLLWVYFWLKESLWRPSAK